MIDRGFRYYPALKLALPYAAGILLSEQFDSGPTPPLALLGIGGLLLAASLRLDRFWIVPALMILLMAAGGLSFAEHRDRSIGALEGRADAAEVIGTIDADPVIRNGRAEIVLRVDSIFYRNVVARPRGRVLARVADTAIASLGLLRGDRCGIEGRLAVPRGPVNPGAPDYAAMLHARGIALLLDADPASSLLVITRAAPGPADRLLDALRRSARDFAEREVGGEEGDIVRALLLGEQQMIDQETRDAFMRTGTIHVLSVSGLHVGIIALGLFVLVSWIPDRRAQLLIFTIVIAGYVVVAGAGPAILRAAIMAVAFLAARAASRLSRPLNTLGLAALIMLAGDPETLFDLGFQLSFVSVAGILMLYAPMREWLAARAPRLMRNAPARRIIEMLLLSIAAQLFTLPFIAHRFGYLSLAGLLANIVVVPLMSLALGAATVGALMAASPLGSWFGASAYLAVVASEKIVIWCAALPLAGVELRPFTAAGAGLLAGVMLYLALARSTAQACARTIASVSAFVSILLLDPFLDPLGRLDDHTIALLACSRGIVVVTLGDDARLQAVRGGRGPTDSAEASRAVEWLRRRIGARSAEILQIDSLAPRDSSGDLAILQEHPRVLAHRALPLLLTATGQRPLGSVTAGGERLIEAPMRGRLEGGIVLRFNRRWEMIRWR